MNCTRFSVPAGRPAAVPESDRVFLPLEGGGRIKASGLSVRGRVAPPPLRVLARPEAESSPVVSARSIVVGSLSINAVFLDLF